MSVSISITGAEALNREIKNIERTMPENVVRALNKTAQRSATRVRRDVAKRIGLPQREIKERIRHYKANRRRLRSSVWVGAGAGIPLSKVRGAYTTLDGTLSAGRTRTKTFRATMPSGYTGQFVRKPNAKHKTRRDGQRTQLPIEEPRIRIDGIAKPILLKHTREQMRDFYPTELRRLARTTIARRARRRRR